MKHLWVLPILCVFFFPSSAFALQTDSITVGEWNGAVDYESFGSGSFVVKNPLDTSKSTFGIPHSSRSSLGFTSDGALVLFQGKDLPAPNDVSTSWDPAKTLSIEGREDYLVFGSVKPIQMDIDSDGVDDFILGSPFANAGTGALHILYSGENATGVVDLQTLPKIEDSSAAYFGAKIIGGDWNGDTFADIAILQTGEITVIWGDGNALPTGDISTFDPTRITHITGVIDLHAVEDIDNDGIQDLILSQNNGIDPARVLVLFGKSLWSDMDINALPLGEYKNIYGGVADIGINLEFIDMNSDSNKDLVLGGYDGTLTVVYGPFDRTDLALNASNTTVFSNFPGSSFGSTFAVKNIDGIAGNEIIVSDPAYSSNGASGAVYIILGDRTWDVLNDTLDNFVLYESMGGTDSPNVFDIDRDGDSEMLWSEPYYNTVTNDGAGRLRVAELPFDTISTAPTTITQLGNSLTCNAGTWVWHQNAPIVYSWYLDGSPIVGQSGSTYNAGTSSQSRDINCQASKNAVSSASSIVTLAAVADPVVDPVLEQKPEIINDPPRCQIMGTAADDVIYGTKGDDVICALAGNDKIYSKGGNDKIYGGKGNDKIYSGAGKDIIAGQDGDDLIHAGTGNDRVIGGAGADRIHGSSGNDLIFAMQGNDTVFAGSGNDLLIGHAGDDRLYGGSGKDKIYGMAGKDILSGGGGNDRIIASTGSDIIYGGAGKDFMLGSQGDDKLYGMAGKDRIVGGAGKDLVSGGDGNDSLYGQDAADIIFGGLGRDFIQAGNGNDIVFGMEGNDRLYGELGEDIVYGNSGNDYIDGGGDSDYLRGGKGKDIVIKKSNDSLWPLVWNSGSNSKR